jgi:hypothetical protein
LNYVGDVLNGRQGLNGVRIRIGGAPDIQWPRIPKWVNSRQPTFPAIFTVNSLNEAIDDLLGQQAGGGIPQDS